jgi:integrase
MHKRIPKALNNEQIKQIFEAINNLKFNGLDKNYKKQRAIMLFYCSLVIGFRPKEVYNARMININLLDHKWFIPKTDNKQRFSDEVYIPDILYYPLLSYIDLKNKYYPDSPYLFPTSKGRIDRSYYNKIFRKALKKSGLYKIDFVNKQGQKLSLYNPYTLRHTFATFVFNKTNCNLKKTAIALRHKDQAMRTTALYVHCQEDVLRTDIIKELYNNQNI